MITLKLWGGLCNQMFQYAFAYALARRHNDKMRFDIDFYNNQPEHLGKRKVISNKQFPALPDLEIVERNYLTKIIENKYISHMLRYATGCDLTFFNKHIVVEKLHRHYSYIPYQKDKDNFYDGYWQSDAYFSDYKNEIRDLFQPSEGIKAKVMEWRNSIPHKCCVAVHVRRGDYLNKINQGKISVIDNKEYYFKAFNLAENKLYNPTFCFFSDDIDWCRETFGPVVSNSIFVVNDGDNASLLDLFSIAQCEHGIMSPSTFSYWGNWLRNPEKKGIVIYPEGDYSDKFITDPNWIEIKRS